MSTAYCTTDRATALKPVSYDPIALPRDVVGKVMRMIEISRVEMESGRTLSALTDHQLNDIGVPRSKLRTLARKVAENPGIDHRAFVDSRG